jgi:hypothetical protein
MGHRRKANEQDETMIDRLEIWEERVLGGDFSQIPSPFRWEQSARFSHFLNGYKEAGGFDPLAHLATAIGEAARDNGYWRGTARELWLCLFFEHRAARHTGSDLSHSTYHDALCETLRIALQALDPIDARALAARLQP